MGSVMSILSTRGVTVMNNYHRTVVKPVKRFMLIAMLVIGWVIYEIITR